MHMYTCGQGGGRDILRDQARSAGDRGITILARNRIGHVVATKHLKLSFA